MEKISVSNNYERTILHNDKIVSHKVYSVQIKHFWTQRLLGLKNKALRVHKIGGQYKALGKDLCNQGQLVKAIRNYDLQC